MISWRPNRWFVIIIIWCFSLTHVCARLTTGLIYFFLVTLYDNWHEPRKLTSPQSSWRHFHSKCLSAMRCRYLSFTCGYLFYFQFEYFTLQFSFYRRYVYLNWSFACAMRCVFLKPHYYVLFSFIFIRKLLKLPFFQRRHFFSSIISFFGFHHAQEQFSENYFFIAILTGQMHLYLTSDWATIYPDVYSGESLYHSPIFNNDWKR